MECPIGLECIVDAHYCCTNRTHCSYLASPLRLPYFLECREENSEKFNYLEVNCFYHPVNTLKDLKECGWAIAKPLPYTYDWDKSLNKYILKVHPSNTEGFYTADPLPYERYIDDWGIPVLKVVENIFGTVGTVFQVAENTTFKSFYLKDGKYRSFPCHTVAINHDSLGFQVAEPLCYRTTLKKGVHKLTVTRTLREEGYMIAIPIEPKKYTGLIVIKASIYYCFPENLKTKTQLKKMKLKLSEGQEPKAYYENRHGFYPLFDIKECDK